MHQNNTKGEKDKNQIKCARSVMNIAHELHEQFKKQKIFGDDKITLGAMTKRPELVLVYAKEMFPYK